MSQLKVAHQNLKLTFYKQSANTASNNYEQSPLLSSLYCICVIFATGRMPAICEVFPTSGVSVICSVFKTYYLSAIWALLSRGRPVICELFSTNGVFSLCAGYPA